MMASLLLDSCAILDVLFQPDHLGPKTQGLLTQTQTRAYFSAISIYEIAFKARLGKSVIPVSGIDYPTVCRQVGLIELPLNASSAQDAAYDPNLHRDPFDRLLVGQAKNANLPLLTRDSLIIAYAAHTTQTAVQVIDSRV